MIAPILLDQWIDNQSAIETTQDDGAGRDRGLAFLDHQAFAFSTGHGTPPAEIDDGPDLTPPH